MMTPMISMIIPTNRPATDLIPTLGSCGEVLAAADVELVVVDTWQERPEADVRLLREHTCRTDRGRLVRDAVPGLLAGRCRGERESNAAICAFLDDDVILDSDWCRAVRGVFADASVAIAGGPSWPSWGSDVPAWLTRFASWREGAIEECAWLSLQDLGDRVLPVDPNRVWGLNFVIRRAVLEQYRGFHPDCMPDALQHFQGDGETGLTMKIAASGHKAVYEPRMKVWHRVGATRMTPVYFYRRAFYQGVCDSFTQLRGLPVGTGHAVATRGRRRLGRVRDALRGIWDRIGGGARDRGANPPYATVKQGTVRAYRAGHEFHQAAYASCSAVRQWVMKPDYRDYALPQSAFDATRIRRECLAKHRVPAIW